MQYTIAVQNHNSLYIGRVSKKALLRLHRVVIDQGKILETGPELSSIVYAVDLGKRLMNIPNDNDLG